MPTQSHQQEKIKRRQQHIARSLAHQQFAQCVRGYMSHSWLPPEAGGHAVANGQQAPRQVNTCNHKDNKEILAGVNQRDKFQASGPTGPVKWAAPQQRQPLAPAVPPLSPVLAAGAVRAQAQSAAASAAVPAPAFQLAGAVRYQLQVQRTWQLQWLPLQLLGHAQYLAPQPPAQVQAAAASEAALAPVSQSAAALLGLVQALAPQPRAQAQTEAVSAAALAPVSQPAAAAQARPRATAVSVAVRDPASPQVAAVHPQLQAQLTLRLRRWLPLQLLGLVDGLVAHQQARPFRWAASLSARTRFAI
eukprot:XP_001692416.1 predicted protein [Chlamydomonas reinhardtii]